MDVTPVIAVQPPSLRATRIRTIRTSSSILNARSARLNVLAGLITQAQRRLNHMRTRCQSALSPASALPEEILRIIFPLALDARPTQRNTVTRSTLSSVCRDWRAAALGQQILWSSSFISDARDEQALRMALGRYHGNDLQLTVKHVPPSMTFPSLIRTLVPRIGYLEWQGPYGLRELLSDVRRDSGYFGALKTLIMDSVDLFASPMKLRDKSLNVSFPQLEVLDLRRTHVQDGFTAPTIRELSLLRVTLTGARLTSLLSGVSNLRRLTVSFDGYLATSPSQNSDRPIRLPHLETLTLTGSFYDETKFLLDHLHAPGLLKLTLEDIKEDAHARRRAGNPTTDTVLLDSINNVVSPHVLVYTPGSVLNSRLAVENLCRCHHLRVQTRRTDALLLGYHLRGASSWDI